MSPLPQRGSLQRSITTALARGKTEAAILEVAAAAAEATDGAIAAARQGTGLAPACHGGCSHCCHVQVAITVPEIVRAATYARKHLSDSDLALVAARARENSARTHAVTALLYPLRLPCAFLDDEGRCRVYEARPLMCRRENALDASQCRDGFENAKLGEDYPVDRDDDVSDFSLVAIEVYRRALSELGVDAERYELQEALHVALSDRDASAAWLNGRNAFARSRLNEAAGPGGDLSRLVQLRTTR